MQALNLDLTDRDDDQNTSRSERDLEKGDMQMSVRTIALQASERKWTDTMLDLLSTRIWRSRWG
jgi:hypothetical protein